MFQKSLKGSLKDAVDKILQETASEGRNENMSHKHCVDDEIREKVQKLQNLLKRKKESNKLDWDE